MTFYNVIVGILFLGACQAVVSSLGSPLMMPAATLGLIILNEAVLTAELVERSGNHALYDLKLKLLDFVGFVVLLWALLVLQPTGSSLQVDVTNTLWFAGDPIGFWSLLAIYWSLTYVWNGVAGQLKQGAWDAWLQRCMLAMPFIFVVFALVEGLTGVLSSGTAFQWLPPATVLAYMLAKLFANPLGRVGSSAAVA